MVQLILCNTVKMKLAILAILYCGVCQNLQQVSIDGDGRLKRSLHWNTRQKIKLKQSGDNAYLNSLLFYYFSSTTMMLSFPF